MAAPATPDSLAKRAGEAGKRSYSPYSKVAVGCALEAEDGTVYTGCNVENASFGLTVCAERTAVLKGVSEGMRGVRRLAIWSDTGLFLHPCGACLQVLAEWMEDGDVILVREDGETRTLRFKDLLPNNLSDLKKHLRD